MPQGVHGLSCMSNSNASQPAGAKAHSRLTDTALRKQARLIDLAPMAAIVRELDGTITFWSEGAEAIYGWTKEEALGRRTHDLLQTVFPTTLEDILANVTLGRKWSGELRHKTKSGRDIIVQSHWLAEVDPEGQVVELLEANIDITKSKMLQESLEFLVHQRTAQLERRNAELEAFAYSLSHDMRGPLRAIVSFTELALEDCAGELGPETKEYLGRAAASARRLDRLLQDVLTLSRVSLREFPMQDVQLHELVRGLVCERLEFQAPVADLQIEGSLPVVHGHEALLTQVITNLLENAVKFVLPDTRPRVRVRGERLGEVVRFWVEDDGIGIDPRAQQKIFELFGRNERSKDYEGTGIGLAIVRKAVERMGGRVGVESEPGNGSRFWVELPQAKARG
jgi:PAS domain S-box-containing protein